MYHQTARNMIRIKVLTAVVMKSSAFWNITPPSPLKVNRLFRGTCRLHLQCRKISQARNKREAGDKHVPHLPPPSCWFLPSFILRLWRWRRHVPPKRRLTFNGLRSIISPEMETLQHDKQSWPTLRCFSMFLWNKSRIPGTWYLINILLISC
jgi:hypothetical protein